MEKCARPLVHDWLAREALEEEVMRCGGVGCGGAFEWLASSGQSNEPGRLKSECSV